MVGIHTKSKNAVPMINSNGAESNHILVVIGLVFEGLSRLGSLFK